MPMKSLSEAFRTQRGKQGEEKKWGTTRKAGRNLGLPDKSTWKPHPGK